MTGCFQYVYVEYFNKLIKSVIMLESYENTINEDDKKNKYLPTTNLRMIHFFLIAFF